VGSRIVILGAGIIGNLWASVLHLQGHRRVIISEPQEARRKLATNLGEEEENSVYSNAAFFTFLTCAMPNDIKTYELKMWREAVAAGMLRQVICLKMSRKTKKKLLNSKNSLLE
jgi:pyrroline-5-carboxylate reductase